MGPTQSSVSMQRLVSLEGTAAGGPRQSLTSRILPLAMEEGRTPNYLSHSWYNKAGTRGTTQSNPHVYQLAARAEGFFVLKTYCKDNVHSKYDGK